MPELAVGATFADHLIRGVAGRGGMGTVYRALHVPLKREVALKVIAPTISADEEFRARFRHEFEAHVKEGRCTLPAPWRAQKATFAHAH